MTKCSLMMFLLGLTCVSARHAPSSTSFLEENPPASASDLRRLDRSQIDVRNNKGSLNIFRLRKTTPRAITKPLDRFIIKSKLKHVNQNVVCNTKSNANMTKSSKGKTIAGSRGLTFSEDRGSKKSLICKSKSFKIINRNGHLKRIAAEGTAIFSNDKNIEKLLSPYKINAKNLELGSKSRSKISDKASKEIVSVVEAQGANAGTSSQSKSRLLPHGYETFSNVDGGTAMEKGLGMRSWSREATRIVSNPRGMVRSHSGRSAAGALTHMSHHKRSNFEIEI